MDAAAVAEADFALGRVNVHIDRVGGHVEHGASFGEKSGWERVNHYESNAAEGGESLRPRGWAGRHWSLAAFAIPR